MSILLRCPRLYHGVADDWVPIDPCRDYVARSKKVGASIDVVENLGAHHLFDNQVGMGSVSGAVCYDLVSWDTFGARFSRKARSLSSASSSATTTADIKLSSRKPASGSARAMRGSAWSMA